MRDMDGGESPVPILRFAQEETEGREQQKSAPQTSEQKSGQPAKFRRPPGAVANVEDFHSLSSFIDVKNDAVNMRLAAIKQVAKFRALWRGGTPLGHSLQGSDRSSKPHIPGFARRRAFRALFMEQECAIPFCAGANSNQICHVLLRTLRRTSEQGEPFRPGHPPAPA